MYNACLAENNTFKTKYISVGLSLQWPTQRARASKKYFVKYRLCQGHEQRMLRQQINLALQTTTVTSQATRLCQISHCYSHFIITICVNAEQSK